MTFKIAKVSPVIIPSDVPVSRRAPRPVDKRQTDYVEKFDYKSMFYDVFECGDKVIFSGPPLFNLESAVKFAKVSLYGRERTDGININSLWKTQRSSMILNWGESTQYQDRSFELAMGKLVGRGQIQADDSRIFKDRKMLLTMSKDNDLNWIRDWAVFYNKSHGVDAVLIYDNGSTAYTHDELLETLRSVEGIEAAVVVDWPFKYGPGGTTAGTWDSDFCQYSALEHARFRFARSASAVASVDIDELIVVDDQKSVFEHLKQSGSGALLFEGRWIENVSDSTNLPPRFSDYVYYDPAVPATTKKWVIDPSRIPEDSQWIVHGFTGGFEPDNPKGISHRHFVGINSNWKKDRTTRVPFDANRHVLDGPLKSSIDKAFGPF